MENIFILRHGIAEDLDESLKKSDFDRKLTDEGKKKIKKLGILFKEIENSLDLVLTSPYIRARETSEIFIESIEPKPKLEIVDFLSVGAGISEISKNLLPYTISKKVLLVGHAPDLEIFLGKLICAKNVRLKKGALAKVTLDNGIELSGSLEWLLTSKIVKKVL